ncbi:hypothetical protein [Pararhizobium sp. DWP3-4]|uniref:hypothetical protein n=1 Tax=Pararhizobium sp. DWP3-4 TaxID=2804565 RepID=UPI003CF7B695
MSTIDKSLRAISERVKPHSSTMVTEVIIDSLDQIYDHTERLRATAKKYSAE